MDDAAVLAEAAALLRKSWTKGSWRSDDGCCIIGAVQKVLGLYQGPTYTEDTIRIAKRLLDVIAEQYPEWLEDRRKWHNLPPDYSYPHDYFVPMMVEFFNDNHTKEEALLVVEKAAVS